MKKLKLTDKIKTERLIIEIPNREDTKEIYNLIDDDITKFMSWNKDYKWVENHVKWLINDAKEWKSWEAIIRCKEHNKILWKFWIYKYQEDILSIELWYWIWKKYWWKWYIPECIEVIKKKVFLEMWYERIVIIATKENINSRKVAEKCWFKLDWILRWNTNIKWKIIDRVFYTFIKDDYKVN